MLSQNHAVCCHKVSGLFRCACFPADKRSMIVVRYKTDLLAVRLAGHRNPCLSGQPAHCFFIHSANGKQGVTQLILCQTIQCIGLVFSDCGRGLYGIPPLRCPPRSGIMSGGYIICANTHAAAKQRFPFHKSVAGNTRIGCPAAAVLPDKIVNHMFPELLPEIHHIMGDFQLIRHPSGILHRSQATAAPFLFQGLPVLFLPDLHCHTCDIISLFF